MGFFNQILVKEVSTDKLIDITDLDKDHYEAFLDVVNRLQIAYQVAVRRQNVSTSEKDLRVCEVINSVSSAPQWFTEDKRKLALQIWNRHETGDNKRVQVVKLIKEWAADEEYVISFKKAYELFQQHCL